LTFSRVACDFCTPSNDADDRDRLSIDPGRMEFYVRIFLLENFQLFDRFVPALELDPV
jgi:hypothetical protein